MDLLKDNIRTLYFKYLRATIGSSIIISIYSFVDAICIGRYEGPDGSSALACFFPMWTLMMAGGLLLGIGGSVYMSQRRGANDAEEGDRYFTTSVMTALILSVFIFFIFNLYMKPLLMFCGAQGDILTLSLRYMRYIALVSPLFLIVRCVNPFVSNDGSPMHATAATVCGGVFNIFGDIFFVFVMDMGIAGAGLATALGQVIAFLVLISYFARKKCTLRLRSPFKGYFRRLKKIAVTGASSFLVDFSMGILVIIFNNQIMRYLTTDALAVYGVAANVNSLLQGLGYGTGEAAQPIMSQNYGAGRYDRIRSTIRYAGITALVLGAVCFILTYLFPNQLINLFMTSTESVLAIAPDILHIYFTSLIFLIFNVTITYFYQSVDTPLTALATSLLRGIVLCGILLIILPALFGGDAIWYALPLAEGIVFVLNLFLLKRRLGILNKSAEGQLDH